MLKGTGGGRRGGGEGEGREGEGRGGEWTDDNDVLISHTKTCSNVYTHGYTQLITTVSQFLVLLTQCTTNMRA